MSRSSNKSKARQARLLIYAAVPDAGMLEQGFYAAEADGLRAHPEVADVRLTNRLADVWHWNYDGLVAYFYSHSAAAALLVRLRGRPAVVTGGGEQVFASMARSRWQYRGRLAAFYATALFAKRILATSTSDRARMHALLPGSLREKIELSFHGAPAVEQPATDDPAKRPPGAFVTICSLDTQLNIERKGILEALALVARVASTNASPYLTIIGRTTRRDLVESYAEALGITNLLHFAGYVCEADKLALLRTHRYYLQLSAYEGFGIGALEALAQGCQVIHTGTGGLVDTIADFGLRVAPHDLERFELSSMPPAIRPDNPALVGHLKQFRPQTRANAILRALFG